MDGLLCLMFTLNTERLVLRNWRSSDSSDASEYASDSEVCKYMDWGPNSDRETSDFIFAARESAREKPRRSYELAIVHREDKKVVGGIGLSVKDRTHSTAMLGYALNRKYWGQGIASEASVEMLRFGFEDLELHRIYATCDTRNQGSRKVLEKLSMRKEAHFVEDTYIKGDWRDSFLFAILRQEWLRLRQN